MKLAVKLDIPYPSMFEVLDLFDLNILLDIMEAPESHAADCASKLSAEDIYVACTCGRVMPTVQVFALGVQSELGAGIRGGPSTPWFNSLKELDEFCQRHISRIRKIAKQQYKTGDYEWMDLTDWS